MLTATPPVLVIFTVLVRVDEVNITATCVSVKGVFSIPQIHLKSENFPIHCLIIRIPSLPYNQIHTDYGETS
jgi:hypothetical protein